MLKRALLVVALFGFLAPLNANATVTFDYAMLITDHRQFSDGTTTERVMADMGVNTDVYDAYIYNTADSDYEQLNYWGQYGDWYEYGKTWDDVGSLSDIENTNFVFFIDENTNSVYDAGTDASRTINHPEGSLYYLDLAVITDITEGINPSMTWNAVEGADFYDVRIRTQDGLQLFRSENIDEDGSTSYSFTYQGDAFEQYSLLDIIIEARNSDENGDLANQSRFYQSHTAAASVPEPATMLLLGSGLIFLAGFRRKFKK